VHKKNIPNIITNLRILAVVIVIVLFSLCYAKVYFLQDIIFLKVTVLYFIILVIFLLASLTDFLDGYLARKWNVISNYGKLMDPLADKLLINTMFIFLAVLGDIHPLFPIIMIFRDMLVDGLRMIALEKQKVIAASKLGKLKTVTQMLAITMVIINPIVGEFSISLIFLILAASISVISGVDYFVKNLVVFRLNVNEDSKKD